MKPFFLLCVFTSLLDRRLVQIRPGLKPKCKNINFSAMFFCTLNMENSCLSEVLLDNQYKLFAIQRLFKGFLNSNKFFEIMFLLMI